MGIEHFRDRVWFSKRLNRGEGGCAYYRSENEGVVSLVTVSYIYFPLCDNV